MTIAKKKGGDDLVSISEAARLRGVSPQAIDQAIDRGSYTAIEVAGRRLLKRSDVVNFKPSKGGKPSKK